MKLSFVLVLSVFVGWALGISPPSFASEYGGPATPGSVGMGTTAGLGMARLFTGFDPQPAPVLEPSVEGVIAYSDAQTVRTYLDNHPDADLQSAAKEALFRYEQLTDSDAFPGMELYLYTQQQETQQIIETLAGRGVDFQAVLKTLPPSYLPKTPESDARFAKDRAALAAFVSSYVSKISKPAAAIKTGSVNSSTQAKAAPPAKKFSGPCTAETFEAEMNLDVVWGQIQKAYATDKTLKTNRYTASYGPDPKCRLDLEIDSSGGGSSGPKLTGGQAWINGRYSKDLSEQISNELGSAPDAAGAHAGTGK